MTLCDLLHKVTWEEVRPYIEQHLSECPGMKLSDYERMFERLRRMAPERWVVPGLFRFYISPDTPYSREWKDIAHDTLNATGCYLADHAFGVPWAVALATRIEQSGYHCFFKDAEWAAYCLWAMSRERIEPEIPISMNCKRCKNKFRFWQWLQGLYAHYRLKRLCRRLRTPEPTLPSSTAKLRKELLRVETSILRLTGKDMDRLSVRLIPEKKRKRIGVLMIRRKVLLNQMFAATQEEVERLERVNALLLDLTRQMYRRSAELYRRVLDTTYDKTFDDDVMVEGSLKYGFNGPESVLYLSNDRYYGSDFTRMLQIIDWLYACDVDGFEIEEIECTSKESIDPDNGPSMSDAELGFADDFDDDSTWAEGWLDHPAFKHICICHAVHDICTHKKYSIPDLLRMNDFWCEVKVTHQHIVEQDGNRWRWWKNSSFEEFRKKLLSEAEYRPQEWRLGQYIVNRTSELFPDVVGRLKNDCFGDNQQIEGYLQELFNMLKKE